MFPKYPPLPIIAIKQKNSTPPPELSVQLEHVHTFTHKHKCTHTITHIHIKKYTSIPTLLLHTRKSFNSLTYTSSHIHKNELVHSHANKNIARTHLHAHVHVHLTYIHDNTRTFACAHTLKYIHNTHIQNHTHDYYSIKSSNTREHLHIIIVLAVVHFHENPYPFTWYLHAQLHILALPNLKHHSTMLYSAPYASMSTFYPWDTTLWFSVMEMENGECTYGSYYVCIRAFDVHKSEITLY